MLPVRGCHPVSLAFPDHSSHILGSAGPRSLATTCGVSVDFLSSGYLDVSVPRVRSLKPMCSVSKYLARPIIDTHRVTITDRQVGCPIRRSMDHGLLPAPHGLSQVITSFIASCCQGIHQTPFSRLIRPGKSKALPDQKQYFPRHPPWFETDAVLVSVLDLDRCVPAPVDRRRCAPTRAHQHATDVYLSKRCQIRPGSDARRHDVPSRIISRKHASAALKGRFRATRAPTPLGTGEACRTESAQPGKIDTRCQSEGLVERIGIEPMTPCLQSRCSPS